MLVVSANSILLLSFPAPVLTYINNYYVVMNITIIGLALALRGTVIIMMYDVTYDDLIYH